MSSRPPGRRFHIPSLPSLPSRSETITLSRRHFLRIAGAVSLGFAGLRCTDAELVAGRIDRPGPLLPDPDGFLDLPEGFSYRVLSRAGEEMDDGFLVPAMHDGQAAFPAEDGRTILIRNHEVDTGAAPTYGPFGPGNERLDRLDPALLFDPGRGGGGPALGGCTGVLWDPREGVVEQWLALAGTLRNCAGGPTPWGTWITCEETIQEADGRHARSHGWAFEVPAERGGAPARPTPLVAMGRFYREAVAVDPATGIVYQTEDRTDGLLYRFLPERPGVLADGGRLQALMVRGRPRLHTGNRSSPRVPEGAELDVEWVDLDEPESPGDDLRHRGLEAGAARFARAEGIWFGGDAVWIACTSGGRARRGQIWRYRPDRSAAPTIPSAAPSAARPGGSTPGRSVGGGGRLDLFMEAERGSLLRRCDNLTVAPWGDLFVCEDGPGEDHLVGVTPAGEAYRFARNARSSGELAGSVFSPDGRTLFLNLQAEGMTLAITGPWPGRS